jgi:hypothetical protein
MKDLFIRARMIEDDEKRDLVIADGVIADADPIPRTEPDTAGWVLPGLADVHNHLSLASPAGDGPDADVRVRASASVELALGVLAIREPGSPDDASARLAGEDGWPRVITAGRFLAPPGGYFPDLAREVTADPDRAHPFLPIMLAHTGRAYLLAGDLQAARTQLEDGLQIARARAWAGVTAAPLALLGHVAVAEGNLDAACGLLEQAFALACQVADPCW